jgi:hypothetical protein
VSEAANSAARAALKRTFLGTLGYALRVIAVNFLIFAVLAEIVSVVLVHRKSWPASKPTYHLNYNQFWADARMVASCIKRAVSAWSTRRTVTERATANDRCTQRRRARFCWAIPSSKDSGCPTTSV